jgi:hypothetical protein
MIWVFALPGPRTIRIANDIKWQQQAYSMRDFFVAKTMPQKLPSLLLVSRESRDVAQEVFYPAFCCQLGHRPIYFNPNQDVLLIETPLALASFYGGFPHDLDLEELEEFDDEVHQGVQYLALGCHVCPRILFRFDNLRELVVVGDYEYRKNLLKAWKAYANVVPTRVPIIVAQSKEGFKAMMDRAIALNPV